VKDMNECAVLKGENTSVLLGTKSKLMGISGEPLERRNGKKRTKTSTTS